jgi:YaiO family outer membrane protein
MSANRQVRENWWGRGGVALAPGASVIPRREYTLGVAHKIAKNIVVGVDYRSSHLATATIQTLAPTVEYYFQDASWLQGTYYLSRTSFRNSGQPRANDNSFAVRYNRQISKPVLMYVGYGRGRESFQSFLSPTIDRIGTFDAKSYLVGGKWQFARNYSLNLYGVRQERSTGAEETTIGVGLSTRR